MHIPQKYVDNLCNQVCRWKWPRHAVLHQIMLTMCPWHMGNGNMLTFETHGKISDYRLGAPRHVTWQNQLLDLSYLALAKECRRLFNNFTFLHKCSRDMNTLHTSSKISTVKKCAFGREKRWTYVETSWKCELMPMHFHRFGWFSKVTCDMDDIWMWMFHRHLSRIQIFNWVCS